MKRGAGGSSRSRVESGMGWQLRIPRSLHSQPTRAAKKGRASGLTMPLDTPTRPFTPEGKSWNIKIRVPRDNHSAIVPVDVLLIICCIYDCQSVVQENVSGVPVLWHVACSPERERRVACQRTAGLEWPRSPTLTITTIAF
ncbi:hypothetical protein L1887_57326 [Cichorium endivia]|nr:hypothetical protein L1887_57326 [Cichorium endivia]